MEEEVVLLNNEDPNDKIVWERSMTLALIQEYKRFEHSFQDPCVKKKLVWKNIAARLHARGYRNVTDDTCDKKWRNLKKTFKDIYSGRRRKINGKWAYYDALEDVLGRDPKIINAYVADQPAPLLPTNTLHTITNKPVIHKFKTADGQNLHVELVDIGEMPQLWEDQEVCDISQTISRDDKEVPLQIICQDYQDAPTIADRDEEGQPPTWFSEFLHEYRGDEERRLRLLQEMHAEVLAMENKKVKLLEQLLEKLSPPIV